MKKEWTNIQAFTVTQDPFLFIVLYENVYFVCYFGRLTILFVYILYELQNFHFFY